MLNRRTFLTGAAAYGAAIIPVAAAKEQTEVTPPEDLMREHGVLNRMLLIYDHAREELSAGRTPDLAALHETANTLKSFIEDYHERQEEEFVFPAIKKAGRLLDLVETLATQHAAGRQVTGNILQLSALKQLNDNEKQKLTEALTAFNRMYRPHEAREDTVLFPVLHEILSPHEFDAMGERFEKREHELFGESGFEAVVAHIGDIEKKLGIYDLRQFTPQTS